eukprot:TRINITY_DN12397_c1_g1_i1.p2 TRINITY_DN12397_c1_g1~~TRINITY_DN12397_c1_g1_i1.p2  ORF type:complete len:143 (+),score=2.43 TRINITY_DN12397_c1_g1_i1:526-954(+)
MDDQPYKALVQYLMSSKRSTSWHKLAPLRVRQRTISKLEPSLQHGRSSMHLHHCYKLRDEPSWNLRSPLELDFFWRSQGVSQHVWYPFKYGASIGQNEARHTQGFGWPIKGQKFCKECIGITRGTTHQNKCSHTTRQPLERG